MKAALLILIAGLMITAYGCGKESYILPPDGTVYSCLRDNDCIMVPLDCCGCNMGGKSTAINSMYKEEWESRRKEKCKDTVCMAVYLCGNERPRCAGGRCVLA